MTDPEPEDEVIRCEVCGEELRVGDEIVLLEDYTVSKGEDLMTYKEDVPLHAECVSSFFTGKFLSLKFDIKDAQKLAEESHVAQRMSEMDEDQKYFFDVITNLKEEIDNRSLEDSGCSIAALGELFVFIIYSPKTICHMICDKYGGKTIMYRNEDMMVTEPVSEFTTSEDVAHHLVDLIDPGDLDDEAEQ